MIPVMRAKFAEMGGEPLGGSPSEFGQLIAEETEKWGKVVKFTGLDRNVQSRKMVHAALLLLMLEAVFTDLVSPSA